MKGLIAAILWVAVIMFMIWWIPFRYHDCLRVGHSKTYCILEAGR